MLQFEDVVIGLDIELDFGHKIFYGFESSTPDRLLCDQIEPDFDLI